MDLCTVGMHTHNTIVFTVILIMRKDHTNIFGLRYPNQTTILFFKDFLVSPYLNCIVSISTSKFIDDEYH